MEYVPFRVGEEFSVAHLRVVAVPVNHIVPTVGLLVTGERATLAFSSDTAATEDFWVSGAFATSGDYVTPPLAVPSTTCRTLCCSAVVCQ